MYFYFVFFAHIFRIGIHGFLLEKIYIHIICIMLKDRTLYRRSITFQIYFCMCHNMQVFCLYLETMNIKFVFSSISYSLVSIGKCFLFWDVLEDVKMDQTRFRLQLKKVENISTLEALTARKNVFKRTQKQLSGFTHFCMFEAIF